MARLWYGSCWHAHEVTWRVIRTDRVDQLPHALMTLRYQMLFMGKIRMLSTWMVQDQDRRVQLCYGMVAGRLRNMSTYTGGVSMRDTRRHGTGISRVRYVDGLPDGREAGLTAGPYVDCVPWSTITVGCRW